MKGILNNGYTTSEIDYYFNKGYENGYRNGIDDFTKKLTDYMVDYKPMYLNLLCIIEEVSEQLKVGEKK